MQADDCTDDVVPGRSEAVEDDAPGERTGDKDAAVRGEDAAEVPVGLCRGDEPIGGQCQHATDRKPSGPVFAH